MSSDLNRMIEEVEKIKGIDKSIIVEALETAMLTAARKKYGDERDIEAQFNDELGEVELFEFKTVVEEVMNDETEVTVEQAKDMDPDAVLGDSIGLKLDSSEFGRISAQTAKQVIIQKVRDAERDIIYNEFNVKKGQVVSGNCRRVERGCIVVDLGKTDGIIPTREQIPGEHFRPGDRITGFLTDVQQTPRGPKVVISRTCPELLIHLFHQEVPEINEGVVEVKGAAREPGMRAKIAVESKNPDVDPVGACVGVKGVRVQAVVQELRGEKIDIISWVDDETRFVCNALAPAVVQKVLLDEQNHSMEIVVADDQLSLAIGKKGQNVKLASILTKWKIDIVSESKMIKRSEMAKAMLLKVEGINETLAQSLYQLGFYIEVIPESEVESLMTVPGMTEEKAADLKEKTAALIASEEYANHLEEAEKKADVVLATKSMKKATGATGNQIKKMSADEIFERLKAEVKAQETTASSGEGEEKEKSQKIASSAMDSVEAVEARSVEDVGTSPQETPEETEES